MKKPNGESKQRTDLVDDKGNYIEFAGRKEENTKGAIRRMGVYWRLIRSAMTEDQ